MISLIYQTENCYCFYNHDIILCELHEKIAWKDCNHPFVADAIYGIAWIGIIRNNITSLNVNIENRKMSEKIIKIPVYTINLRLYPNKEQKKWLMK